MARGVAGTGTARAAKMAVTKPTIKIGSVKTPSANIKPAVAKAPSIKTSTFKTANTAAVPIVQKNLTKKASVKGSAFKMPPMGGNPKSMSQSLM